MQEAKGGQALVIGLITLTLAVGMVFLTAFVLHFGWLTFVMPAFAVADIGMVNCLGLGVVG